MDRYLIPGFYSPDLLYQNIRESVLDTLSYFGNKEKAFGREESAETDSTIEMKISLPGFKPENLEVVVDNNLLKIDAKEEGTRYHRMLGFPFQIGDVDATYKEGTLELSVKKPLPRTIPFRQERRGK